MVDVDMRLPHPPAAVLDQLSGSVCALTLLWGTLVYRKGWCFYRVWYMGFNQISAPCHLTEEPAELQHVPGDGWALYRACAFVTKEIFLLGHSSIKMQFGGH